MSDLLTVMQDYTIDLDLEPTSPTHILQEAADALAKTTHGKVQGSIFTLNPGGGAMFRHTFYLRAPDLNDYTYSLFYVWHNENSYPAHVLRTGEDKQDTRDCADENALREEIKNIFQDHNTRQIVRSLLLMMDSQNSGGGMP